MNKILIILLFVITSCSHFNSWDDPVHKKAAETAKYVESPDYSKRWAIDPIFGNPVSAKEWFRRMKGYDVGGDMTLFTSEAKPFGPSSPDKYNRNHLNIDSYNNYFNDLLKSYRENSGPFNGEVFTKPDVARVGELFKDAIAKF